MEDKYIDFNEKRIYIFSELIKKYLKESLKSPYDLNALAAEIKKKYNFDDTDMPFIKGHIIIAMGLDIKDHELFGEELNIVKNYMAAQRLYS